MGRKSRAKRERRGKGVGPIAQVASGRSQVSLVALLEAACASPTASHRIPSLTLIYDSIVKRTRTGDGKVDPDLLPSLVSAARKEQPTLTALEDFLPYDVRSEVLVRWGEELFRLLSGVSERPIAVVDNLRLLSTAIDPVLIDRLGYGIEDAVELVLRRISHVAGVLASAWSDNKRATIRSTPFLSYGELTAAKHLDGLEGLVEKCRHPERARRVLTQYTISAQKLTCNPGDRTSTFGSTIAVRFGSRYLIPIPAAVLIETLDALGGVLALEASQLSERVSQRWYRLITHRLQKALFGSNHPLTEPLVSPAGGGLPFAIRYSKRRILILDLTTTLQPTLSQQQMEASRATLASVIPGTRLESLSGRGHIDIPSDAEIARLHVVATPNPVLTLVGPDHPIATLHDLLWCVRTTAQSPVDLWYFVHDFTNRTEIMSFMAWSMMDTWEFWRNNGNSFYRGGSQIDVMFFEPGAATAEWSLAAEAADSERSLLALGLAPLSDWPINDIVSNRKYVMDRTRGAAYRLLPWPIPVAIATTDPDSPLLDQELWNLADAIAWKLDCIRSSFLKAADSEGIKALRLEFLHHDDPAAPDLGYLGRNGITSTISVGNGLVQALQEDAEGVETRVGRLIAKVFSSGDTIERFVSDWDHAGPGIRTDRLHVEPRSVYLPNPITVHLAERSRIQGQLARHVADSSTSPGVYRGNEAKRLESEIVYPWLIGRLHRVIKDFDSHSLLEFALAQLEYANRQAWWEYQELARRLGFGILSENDEQLQDEDQLATMRLTKQITLIIEEVVSHRPTGVLQADELVWNQILSIAELAMESCLRSELVHFNLVDAAVRVGSDFEIIVEQSTLQTDVDFRSYARQRSEDTLPNPIIPKYERREPKDTHTSELRPLHEREPRLSDLDHSLRKGLGFGLDALNGVLGVASYWDHVSTGSPIAYATIDEFVNEAAELLESISRSECLHATSWLTLLSRDLLSDGLEHWETHRRSARVMTRPLIKVDDGMYILPWTAKATLRILGNYLGDGRLPWPDTSLPAEVVNSLTKYRQSRNRDLEHRCEGVLTGLNLKTARNIKPRKAHKYGIKSLSGEVDVVGVDPIRSRIWVIEVKDPYVPFSARQVRQQIRSFHKSGGYIDKLLKKVKEINISTTSLAGVLEVPEPDRNWEVRALVATRRVNPAAFVSTSPVPFCTLAGLRQVMGQ